VAEWRPKLQQSSGEFIRRRIERIPAGDSTSVLAGSAGVCRISFRRADAGKYLRVECNHVEKQIIELRITNANVMENSMALTVL
jgi:hypothetical protein